MRLDERIPNLVSELKLGNIWLHFWKKRSKTDKVGYLPVSTVFWPKRGVNVIRLLFWGQIWNHQCTSFRPKMKGLLILHFLTRHCNFKTLVARGRVGMKILEKWNMPICFNRYRAWLNHRSTSQRGKWYTLTGICAALLLICWLDANWCQH